MESHAGDTTVLDPPAAAPARTPHGTRARRAEARPGTVAAFAESLMPTWRFPAHWLYWPPDLFSLTSILLKQTGCYRFALAEEWERPRSWQAETEAVARDWLAAISRCLVRGRKAKVKRSPLRLPERLRDAARDVHRLAAEITLDDLRLLRTPESRQLATELLHLHCIADQACSGFGLLVMPHPRHALVHCLANLLLTARGSLSTLPKHHGIVLPKMRTPQSGLTIRSFSLQVSHHNTEVEVMWRCMPWANVQENTINILAVPWPTTVGERCFRPTAETFESVRYFSYDPAERELPGGVASIVRLAARVGTSVGRVHMIVLPELALTQDEYEQLLRALSRARAEGQLEHVPMVVTGVSRRGEQRPRGEPRSTNEVRLAAYFAGRWYAMSQNKHHRWKLDRNQVRQYSLEGRFATARNWYEHIAIEQRRLNFLAPTGWLALCPLICEDLAQLEPVSDIIRGVGPTLLIALLMDGPQLKHRWSARYASVFADDPGTAVLTLTSVGMAARSRDLERDGTDGRGSKTPTPVALWKDQITGWHPLNVSDESEAVLLTISAGWVEEFTADNRRDYQNAAVFRYEGARCYRLGETRARGSSGHEEPPPPATDSRKWLGDWSDLRELSAATYALDTAIQLRGQHLNMMVHWLLSRVDESHEAALPRRLAEVIRMTREAQIDPSAAGIDVISTEWPQPTLKRAVGRILRWKPILQGANESDTEYWSHLAAEAERELEEVEAILKAAPQRADEDEIRIARGVPLAILMALHARVERLRVLRPAPRQAARRASTTTRGWKRGDLSRLFRSLEAALDRYAR